MGTETFNTMDEKEEDVKRAKMIEASEDDDLFEDEEDDDEDDDDDEDEDEEYASHDTENF